MSIKNKFIENCEKLGSGHADNVHRLTLFGSIDKSYEDY